ncbi:Oidioi.mRNA.OKI2018_I69.chr2.g5948.t1.cds [Oikopleura dioica]|uniref:Oidioi.mRNA.OKI2018_I69.chr2.g5948.t1.cds n=1 Tax=Oikopleura dioica TaxID=34765 RepID=A0ABN7TAY8_OIKDI|nr:Oidioi.mRNA.OKI2018_I69.chr2.g5948.t1.cds [Oikopleura dioica]
MASNLIAIDTEGGTGNGKVTVALVSCSEAILYHKRDIVEYSPDFNAMKAAILRHTSGKTLVGHNVNADISRIGLKPSDFTDTFDTQGSGAITHTSNRTHDVVEDARQSMKIALKHFGYQHAENMEYVRNIRPEPASQNQNDENTDDDGDILKQVLLLSTHLSNRFDNNLSDIFGIGLLLLFVGIFFLLMCCCCILGLQNISLFQQLPCFQSLATRHHQNPAQNNNLNINGHLGCPNFRRDHRHSEGEYRINIEDDMNESIILPPAGSTSRARGHHPSAPRKWIQKNFFGNNQKIL